MTVNIVPQGKKTKPKNPIKILMWFAYCSCHSQGYAGVSRANDANFEASAFELERPESQRRCQQGDPQLKRGPTSTNHHLNHKSMPCGSWAVDFPPWHDRDYFARTPWWLLLQTGTSTRTVISQSKGHSSGAAGEQKFYTEKGMSFSDYLHEPKKLFHCLPAESNSF